MTATRPNLLPWRSSASRGVYTTSQIARLFGRTTAEISQWLRGDPPLIASDYQPVAGRQALSFEGLVEARLIVHLLDSGVPLATIRAVSNKLRADGYPRPLAADRAIVTDGFRVLEVDEDGQIVNLINECLAHPQLMNSALAGRLVFKAGVPSYYEPDPASMPTVRIDPTLAFGRPVVVEASRVVPTAKLAEVAADEGVAEAADWYGVSPSAVEQAASFESRLAA